MHNSGSILGRILIQSYAHIYDFLNSFAASFFIQFKGKMSEKLHKMKDFELYCFYVPLHAQHTLRQ